MSIWNKSHHTIAFAFLDDSSDGGGDTNGTSVEDTPRMTIAPDTVWKLETTYTAPFQKYRSRGCAKLAVWITTDDPESGYPTISGKATPIWTGYVPLTSKQPIVYDHGQISHDNLNMPCCKDGKCDIESQRGVDTEEGCDAGSKIISLLRGLSYIAILFFFFYILYFLITRYGGTSTV